MLKRFAVIHFFYFMQIGDVSDQDLVRAEYAAKVRGEREAEGTRKRAKKYYLSLYRGPKQIIIS